jgi:hypothetical protein
MNDVFNLRRFTELFKKHTAENYKTYFMSIAVVTGILALIMSFIVYTSNGRIGIVQQGIIFLNVMFLSGSIFTSMIFIDLGDRKKAIPVLTLPASHLEKWLVGWIYAFVLFQLFYLGCFYFVDFLVVSVANTGLKDKNFIVNVFSTEDHFWIAFPQFAVLNSICFVGALWFEKMHFIKTAFVFLLFILVVTLFNYIILGWMFDAQVAKAPPFNSVGILEGDKFWRVKGNHTSNVILLTTVCLTCTVLWVSSYFRVREKQV